MIAIPTQGEGGLEDSVGQHFGRVPTYTLIEPETRETMVIQNTSHHMGGRMQPPELLQNEGATILVCRGLGRRAIDLFNQYGIKVYIGAEGTVTDALKQYEKGQLTLASMDDACGMHAFRGQGQGRGDDCGKQHK